MRATSASHRTLFAISLVIFAVNVLSLIGDSRDHANPPLFIVDSIHATISVTVAIVAWRAVQSWSDRTLELTFALDREPWFTLFFAGIAGMLLYTREHRRGLERRLAAAEARAQTLTQVSQVLLALRDHANTPLQTLEVAVSLLERESPVKPAMRRALQRLSAIQSTLARESTHSFDLDVPLDLDAALRDLMAGQKEP
jgi:hypothetical protein